MASHTQHDAMRHEPTGFGNRRHACLELDDSIFCGERSLIKNRQRFAGLVLLLVFAIILLLNVLPAPGTYHGDFDIHGTATTSPAWVSVFNTWLVMPSETLFTSTLSDGNMQFIALTPSELFMPCVMSCLMWCFLIQICLRRKTASLLTILWV